MFAVRRAIARSLVSTTSLRNVVPQITRARVTPVSNLTPTRYFSQIRPRFADEPVQKEPTPEELKDVKEESILEPEIAEESQQKASTSTQAQAATSESTDQLPSEQYVADLPSRTSSIEQQAAATAESTDQVPQAAANTSVYVGNIQFDVDETVLEQEFSKFGDVASIKIVKDDRGQSKGFGFVAFRDAAAAEAAIAQLDETIVLGRRIFVKPSTSGAGSAPRKYKPHRPQNEPSKTLFIGNMSYQMSDRDLNDLFRDIKNVTDVRVAIDRRSGQPRGFAHADFNDIASAQAAAQLLQDKTIYGRTLKVDYTHTNARALRDKDSRE